MDDLKGRVIHVTLDLGAGGLEQIISAMCLKESETWPKPSILVLNEIDPKFVSAIKKEGVNIRQLEKRRCVDLNYYRRAGKMIEAEKGRIIHAHSGCLHDAALFSIFVPQSRIVLTCHGLPVENGLRGRLKDNFAGIFAKKIVAVSEEVAEFYRKRLLFGKNKLIFIRNGVDTSRYKPVSLEVRQKIKQDLNLPISAKVVGTAGRLTSVKNHEHLLRASSRINAPEMHLVIFGEGDRLPYLIDLAVKLNIRDRIHFPGVKYEMENFYPCMDVFVLSSISEGTSIALLEAQSCGIPAVVTNVGGNADVIKDGHNGFVVTLNDDDGMASAIKKVFAPEMAAALSMNSRRRMKAYFSFDKMMQEYEQIYEQI